METSSDSYLDRVAARAALADLKRHAAFGIAISSILVGWSVWNYYFVVGANDELWFALLILGVVGLVTARVAPSIWTLPERALSSVVQHIGHWTFVVVLTFLYLLLVTPLGFVARSGTKESFVEWHGHQVPGRATWAPKEITASGVRKGRRSLMRSLVDVVLHFQRRKLYFLLPFLAVVLALGLALFFVKGSALAPFIYTLF